MRSKSDHCVYCHPKNGHIFIIVLYVDDMLFTGNDKRMISYLKFQLSTQFQMYDLGVVKYNLEMEIRRDRSNIKLWLSQIKYANFVFEMFNMRNYKQLVVRVVQGKNIFVDDCPKSPTEMEEMTKFPYVSFIDSLMYVMVWTIAQGCGEESVQVFASYSQVFPMWSQESYQTSTFCESLWICEFRVGK